MSTLKLFVLAAFIALLVAYVTVKEEWLGIVPADDPESDTRQGRASWYGEEYRGRIMANGKPFDPDAMTCASFAYPLGTVLVVRHGLRSVAVRVTDRGPAESLGRIVDLSHAAFAALASPDLGVIKVTVTVTKIRTTLGVTP